MLTEIFNFSTNISGRFFILNFSSPVPEDQENEGNLQKEPLSPETEEDKDSLIENYKNEIEKLTESHKTYSEKLTNAIAKVEEQLNIQLPEDSFDEPLDVFERILRVGVRESSIQETLKLQINDVIDRGMNDIDFIHETLYTMKDKLEAQASVPTDDVEKQEQIKSLSKIAYDEEPDVEQLQAALRDSLMLHQDSETKISQLQERIIDLEQQINFYLESGKAPETSGLDYQDHEARSYMSAIPRDIRSSRFNSLRASPESSLRYYKPHSSIDTVNGEQIDPYALTKSLRQQIELEYSERLTELTKGISDAKSEAKIADQKYTSMKVKYDKFLKDLEESKKETKKYQIAYGKLKEKNEELQKQLTLAKSKISKLTGKSTVDLTDKDQEKIKLLTAELEKAKAKIASLTAENEKLKAELEKANKAGNDQTTKLKHALVSMKKEMKANEQKVANATKNEEELKKTAEKQKGYLNEICGAIGLTVPQEGDLDDFYSKEVVDQMTKIHKEVEDKKSLLEKVRDSLGLAKMPTEEDEIDEGEIYSTTISNVLNDNEKLKQKVSELRKALGISETDESTDKQEHDDSLNVIQNMKNENQELKEKIAKLQQEMGLEGQSDEKVDIIAHIQNNNKDNSAMKEALKSIGENLGIKPENEEGEPLTVEQMCLEIKSLIDKEIALKENLMKENESIRKAMSNDSEVKDDAENSISNTIKNQREVNERLQKHLQEVLSNLGIPEEESNDKSIEERCQLINTQLDKVKTDKNEAENELHNLKEALGVTDEESTEEKPDIISKTEALKKEHETLQKHLQEVLSNLGIPEEESNDKSIEERCILINENLNKVKTDKTAAENELHNLKEALGVTDEESTEEKPDIISKTEALKKEHETLQKHLQEVLSNLGIPEEESNDKSIEERCILINENLNKVKTDKTAAENELHNLKEALGVTDEESTEEKPDIISKTEALKKEHETLQKHLQEVLSNLGIPEEESNDKSIEERCQLINTQLDKVKTDKNEAENELHNLKEALGVTDEESTEEKPDIISKTEALKKEHETLQKHLQEVLSNLGIPEEESNDKSIEERCILINENLNKVKTDKTAAENELHNLKEALGVTDEESTEEKPDIISKTEALKKEHETLQKHLQEVLSNLGIPEGESNDKSIEERCILINENLNKVKTDKTAAENELHNLKEALGVTDEESTEEKPDIISKTEALKKEHETLQKHLQEVLSNLGIPEEESNDKSIEERCILINENLNKVKTDKTAAENELHNLKEALGVTDEESTEEKPDIISKTEALKKEHETLQKHLQEVLSNLGIPEEESNDKSIEERCILINENLNKVKTDKTAAENELHNLKEALGVTDEESTEEKPDIISKTEALKKEHETLQKHLQEVLSNLGIPEEESNDKSIEERCILINENLNKVKTDKTAAENELHNLKEALGVTDEESTEEKPDIISKTEALKKEHETLQKHLQEVLSNLGIPEEESNDKSIEERCQLINTQLDKVKTDKNEAENELHNLKEALGVTDEESTEEKPDIISKTEALKKEHETLQKHLQEVLSNLGIPEEESNDKSIEERCILINENLNKVKTDKTAAENELHNLKEALGVTDEESTEEKPDIISKTEALKKEHETLQKHLQEVLSNLGIPEEESNDKSIEERCQLINTQLDKVKTDKNEAENELHNLKEALGVTDEESTEEKPDIISKTEALKKEHETLQKHLQEVLSNLGIPEEESNDKSIEERCILINENLNKVKTDKTAAENELHNLKEALGVTDEESTEEKPDIISKTEALKKEHETLQKHLQEVLSNLGIPEEESNDKSIEERCQLINTQLDKVKTDKNEAENELHNLKEALGVTDEESTEEKPDIISKTEALKKEHETLQKHLQEVLSNLGIPEEESNDKSIEERCILINENLNKVKTDKTAAENELHNLKEALGVTDEESTEEKPDIISKTEALKKEHETLQKHLQEVLSNLGIPEEESNDKSIEERCQLINTQLDKVKTDKNEAENELHNLKEALGVTDEESTEEKPDIISKTEALKKEHETLQKHLQEVLSNLGIPEEESNDKSIEERCILINENLNKVKTDKTAAENELHNLKEALGVTDEESTEEKPDIISKTEALKKEHETLQKHLQEVLSNLGIPEEESNDKSIEERCQLINTQLDKVKTDKNEAENELHNLKEALGVTDEESTEEKPDIISKTEALKKEHETLQKHLQEVLSNLGIPEEESNDKSIEERCILINENLNKVKTDKTAAENELHNLKEALGVTDEESTEEKPDIISKTEALKKEHETLQKHLQEVLSNLGIPEEESNDKSIEERCILINENLNKVKTDKTAAENELHNLKEALGVTDEESTEEKPDIISKTEALKKEHETLQKHLQEVLSNLGIPEEESNDKSIEERCILINENLNKVKTDKTAAENELHNLKEALGVTDEESTEEKPDIISKTEALKKEHETLQKHLQEVLSNLGIPEEESNDKSIEERCILINENLNKVKTDKTAAENELHNLKEALGVTDEESTEEKPDIISKTETLKKEHETLQKHLQEVLSNLGIPEEESNDKSIEERCILINENLNKVKTDKTAAENELHNLKEALGVTDEESTEEKPDIISKTEALKKEHETLQKHLQEVLSNLGIPEEESNDKSIEERCILINERISSTIHDLQQNKLQTENELQFAQNQIIALEQDINTVNNQAEKERTSHEYEIAKIKNEAQSEKSAFEQEINELKAEAKNTKISLEKEINELKNEAAIKDITLKSLSYDESKKNDFIHDISRLLQPFKQTFFADASSSEPLESEASFSEEEYGYSEVERPSRTKHEKQSENRPEMTLDEISDCTSRLIEQLEQLQTDNNVLSATREENMNKISNLTNSVRVSDVNMLGLSHERDVLTSLLLDQNEEEEEEEEEEEYTEAQEEIDFDLTDEMMSSEDASHLVHALKKLRNNKSDLESRLSKHKRQSKFLRKQLATLNNAKSAYEKELAQMQDKIKSLQDENFDKQKILTAMIEERQSIREGIVQSLADTIQDSIQNSSELSAPVIDQLHEISNELAKQQQKYHEQINSLEKKRIYDLEHEIELLKKQLEGIDEDIFPITERGILLDLCEEEEEAQDKDPKSRIKRLVNRLKERNEKLNEQIKQLNSQNEELLHEKETVLAAFGLSSNADKAEEDLHEEITSPIFQHVQSLKQEVADRCNEIETLKGLLSSSKSIIQKLTEERSDLLKALYPDANNEEINNEEEEEEEAKDKDALDESLMGNLNNLVSKITENSELMSNTITEGQESNTEPLQLSPRRKAKVAPQRPQAAITDVLKNLREQFNELTKTNVDLQAKYDDLLAEKETILNALGINVGEEEKHESLIFIFINKMKEQLNENCHEIAKLKELLENSTQTIQQLNQERDAILETLNGNIFEVQDDDNSILIDNLSSLDTKINKQSENMNNAIVEPVVPSEGTIPPIPPRSPRKIPPKPTNAIAESLKKLQTELREAMVSVVEKETEVEELKNELNEIHEDIISTMSSLNIPTEEHSTEEEQSTLSLKLKGIHEKLIERFNSFNNQLNEQNDEIAKQKEELTQKTEELTELQTEREAIRQALGLDQENCEEEVIQDIDSPIYNKIQDMKTEIFTLQDELSKIRQLLAKTTKTAQQLSQERESILQALYGNASNTEADNQSQLMENLEYLNSQIGQQSLNMSAAIEEPVEPSVGGVPSTPSYTLMPRSPRPQSAIVAALNKLRNDLKESIQSNLDKDALLDEMKIDLQALSSELSLGLEIEHVDEEEDESNALPLDEQLRKARSAILKKLEALEGDKQEINDKLIELETISQQKDEQLQELQQEKQQKDDQIHTLEEEKQEFIQQISAHELNEQTLSSEKDRLTTEYEELTQKFNELNESVNAAKALLGQAPEETTLSNQLMNFITHSAQEQSAQVSQLESEISSLKKEIERLQEENKALIAEKNAVLGVLGIKNQSGSDQEDDTFIDIESPLFNEVQNMTQKVEDQVHQINLLKTNLETAARTIQQLNQERMSIMNALLPGAPSDSTTKATASLFNSLESLGVQISKQNDEITNAINSSADDESLTSPKSPSTRPRTPRTSVRPQNMIVAALENIRKQLNLALEESSEKDVNIAELENELDAKEQRISELEKELVSIAATLGLEMNEKEKEDILNTVSKIKSEIQRLKSEAESCQSQLHNMKQI